MIERLVEDDAPTWQEAPIEVNRPLFGGGFKINVPAHAFESAAKLFLYLLTDALLLQIVLQTNLYAEQTV